VRDAARARWLLGECASAFFTNPFGCHVCK